MPLQTVDAIAGDVCVDYIKYDVEGSEREALEGSLSVIQRDHPALLVSMYHRSEDIFSLILYLRDRLPEGYRLYLRRLGVVPAWDLDLLAIPEKRK